MEQQIIHSQDLNDEEILGNTQKSITTSIAMLGAHKFPIKIIMQFKAETDCLLSTFWGLLATSMDLDKNDYRKKESEKNFNLLWKQLDVQVKDIKEIINRIKEATLKKENNLND